MKRYISYYVIFCWLVIKLSIYTKLRITVPIFIRTFDLILKYQHNLFSAQYRISFYFSQLIFTGLLLDIP